MQKEEVTDLKYISIEEMKDIKRSNNENYTFITWDNFDKIIELLSQKRINL